MRVDAYNSVGLFHSGLLPMLTDQSNLDKLERLERLETSSTQTWRGLINDLAAMMLPYMGSSTSHNCILMLPHADINRIFENEDVVRIYWDLRRFFLDKTIREPSTQVKWVLEEIGKFIGQTPALEHIYHTFCMADKYLKEDSLLASPHNRGYPLLHAHITAVFSGYKLSEFHNQCVERLGKNIEEMRKYICEWLNHGTFNNSTYQERFRRLPKEDQYVEVE